MTYTQVLNKIKRVLESCHTETQLKIGKRYCGMLISKYGEYNKNIFGFLTDKWIEIYDLKEKYKLFDNFPRNT